MKTQVFLKSDPLKIQFPIAKRGNKIEIVTVPRNWMLASERFIDDETIHMIAYDPTYQVLEVIKHIKNTDIHKRPIEVEPIAHYFGLVEQKTVDSFMNAKNKTDFFVKNIVDKYMSCDEPILPYFL